MKLTDVLQPTLIKYPLVSDTKVEVIRELISLLAEQHLIEDKEAVLKAVLDREKIMTTGVGNGIAIPHCKSRHAPDFAIALGIHPEGVDFQSLDSKPVHIVFLLTGPEDKPGTHIRLLSRISRIISRENVQQQILNCHSAEEIYKVLQEVEDQVVEISP